MFNCHTVDHEPPQTAPFYFLKEMQKALRRQFTHSIIPPDDRVASPVRHGGCGCEGGSRMLWYMHACMHALKALTGPHGMQHNLGSAMLGSARLPPNAKCCMQQATGDAHFFSHALLAASYV